MRSVWLGLMGLLSFVNPTPLIASDHARSVPANSQEQRARSEMATRHLMQLNQSMFGLYDHAIKIFQNELFAKHPIIIAQLSGSGGRLVLYRPGLPPEEAEPIPAVYQYMKAVSHSTLAVSEIGLPYVDRAHETGWIAPMRAYLAETKRARDGLDFVDMPQEWRVNSRAILDINIKFMEECLAKGQIAKEALDAFGRNQRAHVKNAISWAAQTQVSHLMTVLDAWQQKLGGTFDQAYAATNTIYVMRQNNIIFSILAQYFGPQAINDRLLLIETLSFTPTQDDIITKMVRILADRVVGQLLFGNNRVMDYELMGTDAREAIIAGMKARGRDAMLPPLVPYGSNQWPALISGGSGPATLGDLH